MKRLLVILGLITLLGCSSDERIVDNSQSGVFVLTVTEGNLPKVAKHDVNQGELISDDIFAGISDVSFNSKIDKINGYRDYIYILQAELNSITIINKSDYSLQKQIDLSTQGLEPIDICFPNATDAYILCKDKVIIFDITVLEPAITIDLGVEATAINCFGNQVFTANTMDNSVSLLDTRQRNIYAKIDVNPYPIAVDILNDGTTIGVLCAGFGKYDERELTSSYIDYIDIPTQTNTLQLPLDVGNVSSVDLIPKDMVVTSEDWIYVIAKELFFRVDLKNRTSIEYVSRLDFEQIFFDNVYEFMIITEIEENNTGIYTINDFNGQILSKYDYPEEIIGFLRE
jgi:hypothetical protein